MKDVRELMPPVATKHYGTIPYVILDNGAASVYIQAHPYNFDLMDNDQVLKVLMRHQKLINIAPEYIGKYRSPRSADLEQQIDYLTDLMENTDYPDDRRILEEQILDVQARYINTGRAAEYDCAWVLSSPPNITEDGIEEFFDLVHTFTQACEQQKEPYKIPSQQERDAAYMRFGIPTQAVSYPTSEMGATFMPTIPGGKNA